MFELRVAEPGDEAAVSELLAASYTHLLAPDYEADVLEAALPLMAKAQPKLLASGTYYIAEIDGRIAACGGWTLEAPGTDGPPAPGEAHIRHFGTHPDLVRRGAAGMVLRHCIAKAAAAGTQRLYAMSTRTAERFYSAHGFRRINEKNANFPGGVRFPSIEMMLECR